MPELLTAVFVKSVTWNSYTFIFASPAICDGVMYSVSETSIFSVPATDDFCDSCPMSL